MAKDFEPDAQTVEQQNTYGPKAILLPFFSLFSSVGTLLCCALPALLVSIGAGASLAGLVSSAPWLVTLSKYKVWTFGLSGGLILLAGIFLWSARGMACPVDSVKAKACARLRGLSIWVYFLSIFVWLVGFFFAFLAIYIFV